MKRHLILIVILLMALPIIAQNHWTPNPYQFPNNMTVTAVVKVNEVEQRNETIEIGAFYEEECRGSALLQKANSIDRYYFFLTLYGETWDEFYFKLYDHLTETELELVSPDTINYVTNGIVGNVADPYVFTFDGGSCELTAWAEPSEGGTVTGAGNYLPGAFCTLMATPTSNYSFMGWEYNGMLFSDAMELTLNVLSDMAFVARFEEGTPVVNYYSVELSASPAEGGLVEGGGVYQEGEVCIAAAIANPNYEFACWLENGEWLTDEEKYVFVVDADRQLVAKFSPVTAVEEILSQRQALRVYDIQGRLVWEYQGNDLNVKSLKNGVYLIHYADGSVRKRLVY